jgi:hypothetical protein
VRAQRLDVEIVTGAAWTRDVQLVTPGPPVAVETLTPGGRYYVAGMPVRVASVAVAAGRVDVALGDGLYGEPVLSIPVGALLEPAVPVAALTAEAGFAYPVPGATEDDPPTMDVMPISATISADGFTITLALDDTETAALADDVGAYSWDVFAETAEFGWRRIIEGTLTIMAGDAR